MTWLYIPKEYYRSVQELECSILESPLQPEPKLFVTLSGEFDANTHYQRLRENENHPGLFRTKKQNDD